MAEKLIFPIGFDLEAAVKSAEKEGEKAVKRLGEIFSRQPLIVKTDTRGFRELEQSADELKTRLKEITEQWNKMPTSAKFNLDSEGRVKQLTAEGKALWDELMRINTALQGVSMGITQMARESQRQLAAENKAEQKRQQAISASLRAEYKRIEAKKQSEAQSRRELEMLNRQYAAEERRQRLAASQASIAKRQQIINTLRAEENTIVNITAKLQHWQKVMNSSDMSGKQFKRATEEVQRLSQKLSEAQSKIDRLTGATTSAASKQSAAVKQVTNEYKNQDGYVSRLIKRLAVYAGFSAVSSFLTNIREVTAQFELQRVSLGAIIQDQTRANQLFSEIKSFAIQSPISIMDLTKYTKQVAAYRIETDKLFDTTKRLADVSVGLGVDMGRIVLAYGQVKAASYLRAAEIRQFTEAGIPMLELLAEKFSELEGQMVSTEKVMDLVSKRAVSFSMVEEIFNDMTSAGGMFYNMQEKQGNTLYGLWAKLGDAASVMYDEIGNTDAVNSSMKGTIQLMTSLMKNWRLVGREMLVVGATIAFISTKSKIHATSTALQEAALNKVRTAGIAYNAILAEEAKLLKIGTAAQLQSVAARKANAKAALDAAIAERAAVTSTTLWTRSVQKLIGAIAGNWITLVVAAIAAIGAAIYSAYEKATHLNKALSEIKSKGLTDMSTSVNNFNALANAAVNAADGTKQQRDALEELKRTYGNIIPAQDLTIEKLRAMRGEYTSLTTAIKENIAQQMLQQSVDTIKEEYAPKLKKSRQNLKDYLQRVVDSRTGQRVFNEQQADRILKNYERYIDEGLNYSQAMRAALELEGKGFTAYAAGLTKSASGAARQFYATQMGLKNAIKGVSDELSDSAGELGEYQKAWQNMQEANANMTIKGEKGTFLYSQEQKNEQIKGLKGFLESVLGDAWSDSYASIYSDVGKDADKMSELFWERIEASADSPAQKNAIDKAKAAYYQIIPQSETVRIWQDKAQEIAKAQGFAMDNARKFLIGDNQNLKDYRKKLEDDMKGILESLKEYTANKLILLAAGKDTTSIDNAAQALEKEKSYVEALLAALPKFETSSSGRGSQSDPRLGILQEMVSTLKQVNKEYDELAKKEGATKALADTTRVYQQTFDNIKALSEQYKFDLPDFGVPTDAASLTKYLDAIKKAMAKLPKSDKAVLALQVDIEKLNIDDMQKTIEQRLKELSDKIARTKTAREFYDKILSQTGDVEMAGSLTMSIFGNPGQDLKEQIAMQIYELMQSGEGGVEIGLDVVGEGFEVNYKNLRKLTEEAYKMKKIGDDAYKQLMSIADNGEKDVAKMVEGWMKATEKAKTYTDKLLDASRTTRSEIEKIEAQRKAGNITDDYAASQIQGFKDKLAKEQTTLAYEAFKDSPMYVQMFDDLDNASTRMLENMKTRMEALKGEWKNLTPTQLKEMQSRLNEIDNQLAKRNPFKTLAKSIRDYRSLMKNGDARGNKSAKAADADLMAATKVADEARKKYNELIAKFGKDSKSTVAEVKAAKAELDKAMEGEEAAQKAVENWKKVKDAIGLSANELFQMLNWAGDIAKGVADISEAVGADEEDVQYWNDMASALGEISGGIQDIVSAAMSGDIVGIISSVITAVPKMFVGFFNLSYIGRIKRANKEIRRQAELLEQLEYTYSQLEKAAEKVFGGAYIANYNQQLKVLNARAAAYQKQLDAEKSKGKKADKEKLKEYANSYRDTMDEIADMQGKLSEKFLGTDITSAARDFAKSWLDAYKQFSNTADAMSEKFRDMIENMVVESLLAKAMQKALEPAFKMIDDMKEGDFYNPTFWKGVMESAKSGAKAADASGKVIMQWAKDNFGFDPRDTSSSELTGIKRDIASASEEQITGLAATMNTWSYYVSFVPGISSDVAAMRQILEQGVSSPIVSTNGEWTDWQQQAMDNYIAIQRNTADTVVECKRIAVACAEQVSLLKRVITNNPSTAAYGVKVFT